MGLFRKKNKKEGKYKAGKKNKNTVCDIHAQLENARLDLAKRRQNVMEQNNSCTGLQQEIDRISGECEILREKNRKRWRKVGVLCLLFLLLGIGAIVATACYFRNTEESYADHTEKLEQEWKSYEEELEQDLKIYEEKLAQEYNEKRAEIEQMLMLDTADELQQ